MFIIIIIRRRIKDTSTLFPLLLLLQLLTMNIIIIMIIPSLLFRHLLIFWFYNFLSFILVNRHLMQLFFFFFLCVCIFLSSHTTSQRISSFHAPFVRLISFSKLCSYDLFSVLLYDVYSMCSLHFVFAFALYFKSSRVLFMFYLFSTFSYYHIDCFFQYCLYAM